MYSNKKESYKEIATSLQPTRKCHILNYLSLCFHEQPNVYHRHLYQKPAELSYIKL